MAWSTLMNPTPTLEYGTVEHRAWYEGMNGYQWWVLIIGSLAWLCDTMDQRIFVLSRQPALSQLQNLQANHPDVIWYGKVVTAVMITGWAVGGLFFGIMGDRWGRVKTLSVSVLVYSSFTGLSGLSQHWYDFCMYRFLMGCGIGGAFATAATLIAETLPAHSRAFALGFFQAISAFGNMAGSAIARWVIVPDTNVRLFGKDIPGWRVLFFFGVIPAFLVVLIMRTLREPDAWLKAKATAKADRKHEMGDIKSMFTHPTWRRNLIVGVTLAVAGVVGLWGVGFWTPELINEALKNTPKEKVGQIKAMATFWQDVGAFFGIFFFTVIATRVGRKVGFAIALIMAYGVTVYVFSQLSTEGEAYWMTPLVGFATLSIFGGYAIYFPEIFPARLRSTGTGLCYNSARVLAAVLILSSTSIDSMFRHFKFASPFRAGAIAVCSIYLIGLIALIWAPETKGKPLPED
jgi:MFS family permease